MRRIPFGMMVLAVLQGLASPAPGADLDELTVVTMAQDGSWGVATASSQGQAIAAAIRACRVMAGGPSDRGAQFVTTRDGWVVASLCGDHKMIVSRKTREAAERAALAREIELKNLRGLALPLCRHVLTVDAHGSLQSPNPPSIEPGTAHIRRGKNP
jgi:hypothetical protein